MVKLWRCDKCKKDIYKEEDVNSLDIKQLCITCRAEFIKWVEGGQDAKNN